MGFRFPRIKVILPPPVEDILLLYREFAPAEERIAAAERILEQIGRFIWHVRWPWVQRRLLERAASQGSSLRQEFRHASNSALLTIALDAVGDLTPDEFLEKGLSLL